MHTMGGDAGMEAEGRLDAIAMARVPRLDASLAATAIGLGLAVTGLSEPLGLLPLTWEPPLLGVVAGLVAGALLRRQCRLDGALPSDGRARLRFLRSWIAVGALAGALVCLLLERTLPNYIPPPLLDGIVAGGIVALVAFPACLWLLERAGECVRARLGSLVSHADRRALWGVTGVLLATSSLTGLWTYASRLPRFGDAASFGLAGTGTAIALAMLLADWRASAMLGRLASQRANMAPLQFAAGEDSGAKTDLGVGQALIGTLEAGSTYRGQGKRIPLVRGSFHDARRMIDRALSHSMRRFGLTLAMLAVHGFAWAFLG